MVRSFQLAAAICYNGSNWQVLEVREPMEDSRWPGVAEAYRAVQNHLRDGRWQEALDQAERIFAEGGLGRKHTARLHSQVCWLYTEQLQRICPAAVLHGEEAVRLADMVNDEWIRTEARSRLVHAYCRLGDVDRARNTCREISRELEKNGAALVGGTASLMQLEATIAMADGDEEGCLSALCLAEEMASDQPSAFRARIYLQKALALLEYERYDEAADLLADTAPPAQAAPDVRLEWDLARVWLAVFTQPCAEAARQLEETLDRATGCCHTYAVIQCLGLKAALAGRAETGEASRLARQALERCHATGRYDLNRLMHRRLSPLL
ncbi:MAG: hypothetical protein K0R39_1060 [Symbiobacteriaceae bacterium]|jgi:hypothetical protein|nr:hypothetical protein [Symbiobacteriaceae bacterium]